MHHSTQYRTFSLLFPHAQLPRVCDYQMVRYSVTVNNSRSETVHVEGPHDGLYGELGSTVEVSTRELAETGRYLAEVTFDVLGIEEDSDEYHKSVHLNVGMLITMLSDYFEIFATHVCCTTSLIKSE